MTMATFGAPTLSPLPVVNCCVLAVLSAAATFSLLLLCVVYGKLETAESSEFKFVLAFKKNELFAEIEKSTTPTCTLFDPMLKLLIMEEMKLRTLCQLEHVASALQIARELSTMNTISARVC